MASRHPSCTSFNSLDLLETAVWILEPETFRIWWVNRAALELWKVESLEEFQAAWQEAVEQNASRLDTDEAFSELDDGIRISETWTIDSGTESFTLCLNASGLRLEDGRLAGLVEGRPLEDARDQSLTEKEISRPTHRLVSLYDGKGQLLSRNAAARRVFDDSESSLFSHFILPADALRALEVLETDLVMHTASLVATTRGSRWHDVEIRRIPDPLNSGFVLLLTEIDSAEQPHPRLRDPLLGLPDAQLFEDRLNQAVGIADRHRGRVGILLLELQHFLQAIKAMGESAEQLEQLVAQRLGVALRKTDSVTRLGPGWYAVLLPLMKDVHEAAAVASKINLAFDKTFTVEQRKARFRSIIGIAIAPEDGLDARALLQRAESAINLGREHDQDRYHFFSPGLGQGVQQRSLLRDSLRRALRKDELVLYYQPRMDIASDRIDGVEILLRWQHPELGLLAPYQFLPLAEQTGMMSSVEDWVLRQACMESLSWQLGPLKIAINVSGSQLWAKGFRKRIANALSETGADPGRLELEISEGTLGRDPDRNYQTLSALHDLGLGLTIDNFGTGHLSLEELKRMPVGKLKIDARFTRGISLRKEAVIAETIVTLARNLKYRVGAEGVESDEQLKLVKELGCDEYQGYYLSRPLPVRELEQWIQGRIPESLD